MLRFFQSKAVSSATRYYTQALAQEDYYTQGREIVGEWHGIAAERLNLLGPVTKETFSRLCRNRHPESGDKLTPRTRDDRTVGYDVNFHAPKGVSLLQALAQDEAITDALRAAVRETMLEIEHAATTRVRLPGPDGKPKSEDRPTGNLVWGEFVHFTARPVDGIPDPHLHVHCFVQNATYDPVEERWKALKFDEAYRDKAYFEAGFHTRLAGKLKTLGYAIDRTAEGWDIAGVDRDLIEKFSRRTLEIERLAAERDITDPDAKGELGAKTRKSKDDALSHAELTKRWDERLTPGERDRLNLVAAQARMHRDAMRDPEPEADLHTRSKEALDHAIAHTFERNSTIEAPRLVAEALRYSVGDITPEDVWREFEEHPELLSRGEDRRRLVTTRSVLEEERAVLRFAVEGRGIESPLGAGISERPGDRYEIGTVAASEGFALTEAQAAAVDHVLNSRDRVQLLRGGAGTGKTTLLKEAAAGIRHGGKDVMAVAITSDASRGVLREAGFEHAETLQKFLTSPDLQRKAQDQVIWVDEAGMVGTPTMHRLFEVAERIDARVVLAGDTKQHRPVERGDGMALIEHEAEIKPAEVNHIVRQQGLYRDAVAHLNRGELTKSVETLDRMGAIREIEGQDRHEVLADRYTEVTRRGRSALVVSPTHAEGKQVTAAIRDRLKASDRLKGPDQEVTRLKDTQWTAAQKADVANFEVGQVIQFTQHCPGIPHRDIPPAPAGLKANVIGCDKSKNLVTIEDAAGNRRALPTTMADRFNVYYKESVGLAVGEKIRITKNGHTLDGKHRLTNGSHYTVAGFTDDGHIKLANKGEWTVSKSFGHLNHGYCETPQAAQGKSVDVCLAAVGASSLPASTMNQLYVVLSRGKKGVELLTDHRKSLMEAVSRLPKDRSATAMMKDAPSRDETLKAHATEVARLKSIEKLRWQSLRMLGKTPEQTRGRGKAHERGVVQTRGRDQRTSRGDIPRAQPTRSVNRPPRGRERGRDRER